MPQIGMFVIFALERWQAEQIRKKRTNESVSVQSCLQWFYVNQEHYGASHI